MHTNSKMAPSNKQDRRSSLARLEAIAPGWRPALPFYKTQTQNTGLNETGGRYGGAANSSSKMPGPPATLTTLGVPHTLMEMRMDLIAAATRQPK